MKEPDINTTRPGHGDCPAAVLPSTKVVDLSNIYLFKTAMVPVLESSERMDVPSRPRRTGHGYFNHPAPSLTPQLVHHPKDRNIHLHRSHWRRISIYTHYSTIEGGIGGGCRWFWRERWNLEIGVSTGYYSDRWTNGSVWRTEKGFRFLPRVFLPITVFPQPPKGVGGTGTSSNPIDPE